MLVSSFLTYIILVCYKFDLGTSLGLNVTPWIAARQSSLSFTISWCLLKLKSIESLMPSNHPILCHPLLLLSSVFPIISVFPIESAVRIRYWRFRFSISPSNVYSVLISLRIDWFDLLIFIHHNYRKGQIKWKKYDYFIFICLFNEKRKV